MFWPERMCKARVIAPKSMLKETIESAEKYGGIEIRQLGYESIKNEIPPEENSLVVAQMLRVEALSNIAGTGKTNGRLGAEDARKFLESGEFAKAENEITGISGRIEKAGNEIGELKGEKKNLRLLSKFDVDFFKLKTESAELSAGTVPNQKMPAFRKMVSENEDCAYLEKQASKNSHIALIAAKKGTLEKIDLPSASFEKIAIAEGMSSPHEELGKVERRIAVLQNEMGLLKQDLERLSENYSLRLEASKEMLFIESSKASATALFGGTEHAFIMEAYLPEKNYAEFRGFMENRLGETFFIRMIEGRRLEEMHEQAPTLLKHSRHLFPFEFMTKFMSMPKSNELDPTNIFLVFFPIFYGMMVGDVVYGLVSAGLSAWIVKKTSPSGIMNNIAKIWMWSAIPTIIFGFIFDEFAGMPHEKIFSMLGFGEIALYHGIERMASTQLLLTVAILLGVVTIASGFLLGFVNAARHRDRKHELVKYCWFCIVVSGTVLVSTAMFSAFPGSFLLPAGILFLLSLAAVIYYEGVIGLLELSSVVGNILSFARIVAVGLVGTVIALILNTLLLGNADSLLLAIIIAPVYIIGHLMNAFLAMFESLIQGARLNYVELYSKFYEGGGKEFAPFRFSRKAIKE